MIDCDVCVIGSGAGGGPVALPLAEAGFSVVILEKGPWLTEKDFYKDEIVCCRRNTYTRNLQEEFQSCMHELLQLQTKEKLDTITRAIKRAEQEQDAQKVDRLMQEFQVITRSFHGAKEN